MFVLSKKKNMTIDKNNNQKKNRGEIINTVYFESLDLSSFFENLENSKILFSGNTHTFEIKDSHSRFVFF